MKTDKQIESMDSNKIVEYNEFESKLKEFEARYIDVVYDMEDDEQIKQAKSDGREIGKFVRKLDKKHDIIKAPHKAFTDLIDSERKRIKDSLELVKKRIVDQVKAHEKKIQDHEEMLQNKVDCFEILKEFIHAYPDSDLIIDRIEECNVIIIDDSYEHRKADATLAQVDTIKYLNSLLKETKKRELEQAELNRLREEQQKREQQDRDNKIKEQAAEQARNEERLKADKEKADNAKSVIDYEKKLEKERQDKINAENALIEAEKKAKVAAENAAKAEREKIARNLADIEKENRARESDKAHRVKVKMQAVNDLMMNTTLDMSQSKEVVTAISKKLIANTLIQY